jgi:hypothetical protein
MGCLLACWRLTSSEVGARQKESSFIHGSQGALPPVPWLAVGHPLCASVSRSRKMVTGSTMIIGFEVFGSGRANYAGQRPLSKIRLLLIPVGEVIACI